jgi:RHS repeat-associated protein
MPRARKTGITDYTYDSRGLVTQIKDARNVVANMTYDNAGRVLTRVFPASTTENVTFAYDSIASGNKGKGRLTQLTDPAGNSKYVYDMRGNLLSETRTIGTVAYVVSYTYDGADRLLTMTYPSGRVITYVRNANGKITGVTSKANATAAVVTLASNVLWQPNVAGAVSGETVFGQGNIATAVQNQALPSNGGLGTVDLLQSLTYGNGLVLFKNFNTDNELFQLIVEQSPSTLAGIRINRFYNRADDTNITGIADGLTPANDETYSYTDAGRLAGATSSTSASYGTRSWTYDNNGNRATESANGVVSSYYLADNSNRLSNVAQGSVSKRIFTYDAAGNVIQDYRNNTNAYNYTINNAGRIRQMSLNTGTSVTTYNYDGMQKLRVKAQTTPVSTTHYIWDSFGHIIAEHASAGGVQKEYIWLGDTPLAVFEGANLFYVHPDNLDRPVMMTNNNIGQTIAWQAKYDPFGNPVTVTSAITNNQRLPGQWFQIEDGLAYNWHRTYDASLGRYTQADPLGFVDGPSVYAYAGSSPIMRVDPEGRSITGIAEFCYFFPAFCSPKKPDSCSAPDNFTPRPLPPLLSTPPQPLPDGLIGGYPRPGGGRINTTAPSGSDPDELFGNLTGGQPPTVLPDGTKIGPNGIRLRPGRTLPSGDEKGPRIDIPGKGDKLPETIHWD